MIRPHLKKNHPNIELNQVCPYRFLWVLRSSQTNAANAKSAKSAKPGPPTKGPGQMARIRELQLTDDLRGPSACGTKHFVGIPVVGFLRGSFYGAKNV